MSPSAAGPSMPSSPVFSRGSSLDHDRETSLGPDGSKRVLRIKRMVHNKANVTLVILTLFVYRSMESGRQKLFGTQPLSAHMFEADRLLKRKQHLLIVWHLLVMQTKISERKSGKWFSLNPRDLVGLGDIISRLEEEIARMKKNQERRLHRKNAKIVKEGGTPMQLNRQLKPDTTVCIGLFYPSHAI
jgi:hypothetical protein